MMIFNSVDKQCLRNFRRLSMLIFTMALFPVATIAQTISMDDSVQFKKGIGICGGVFLKIVELPKIAAKPSQGKFTIDESFENFNLGQQIPVYFAIREWEALIDSSGFNRSNFPILFRFGPLNPDNVQALTTPSADGNGNLVSAEITFDNDGSTNWFIDNSPGDDSEFTGSNPPQGIDLLSVTRHEIGHALGWNTSKRVTVHLSGNTFNPTLLNIATTTVGGFHTDPNVHANEIMNPGIGAGIRRPISLYPAVAMVSKAFHYWIPRLRCVDGHGTNIITGSVYQPWRTIQQAFAFTPAQCLLLVRPEFYLANMKLSRSTALEMIALRGGNVVITVQ